jgi:spore germination cell wall hydrolase CwlJ-like protein
MRQKGQFSWYRRGMKIKMKLEVLTEFFEADNMPPVLPENAEYFHNMHVHPAWVRGLHKVGRIGRHIFYAERAR